MGFLLHFYIVFLFIIYVPIFLNFFLLYFNNNEDNEDNEGEEIIDEDEGDEHTENYPNGDIVCSEDETLCDDKTHCFALTQQCNGVRDCRDGSDETGCHNFDQDNNNSFDEGPITDLGHKEDENEVGFDENGHDYENENEYDHENGNENGNGNGTGHDNEHEIGHGNEHETGHENEHETGHENVHETDRENEHETDHENEHETDHDTEHTSEHVPEILHSVTQCYFNQFTCQSGECIDDYKKCDNNYDCADGSDENECDASETVVCHEQQFACHDGQTCINLAELCDYQRQCPDGSDELNCPGSGETF